MGGSRNLNKVGGGRSLPFPFPSPSPSLLDVGLLKPAKGSGDRCKLPQRGPGRILPAENEFDAPWSCQKATGGCQFEYSEFHVLRVWRDKLAMVSPLYN